MLHHLERPETKRTAFAWSRFSKIFIAVWTAALALAFCFSVLMDPYDALSFSLPIKRTAMSGAQRHMYPQIAHSGRFDSFIIGTSTARLIDPDDLDGPLGTRFANLAMDNSRAWEGQLMMDYIVRRVGPPKMLLLGLDTVWCTSTADRDRTPLPEFPKWLYDDNRWNDLIHYLNNETVLMSVRLLGFQLGLRGGRWSANGYQNFLPPESEYDLTRARQKIWGTAKHPPPAQVPPVRLSPEEKRALSFPALDWLDQRFAQMKESVKVLAFMPVHITAQPVPGSHAAAIEEECKARVVEIAKRHGAMVFDWRIHSSMTSDDSNYWDPLHYRIPTAKRLAREIVDAVQGKATAGGSYRILVD